MIVDPSGKLVWFHPLDTHGVADFKVQTYGGRPVLTWWRGRAEKGVGDGYYVIMSNAYHEIARVSAGNGLAGDIHEFLITPRNTALITVYHRIPRDLSESAGRARGRFYEGIVQELDIATGRVLFEWHSADHVAVAESYADAAEGSRGAHADPYDYFHINSIDREPDGNASRLGPQHPYRLRDRPAAPARSIWRLGGKKSDFAMGPGTRFAWQHDARRQPDGTITLFDNEAEPRSRRRSRVLVLRVDPAADAGDARAQLRAPGRPPRGEPGQRAVPARRARVRRLGSRAVLHGVRRRAATSFSTATSAPVPTTIERSASPGSAARPTGRRPSSREPRTGRSECLQAGTARPRSTAGRSSPAPTRRTSTPSGFHATARASRPRSPCRVRRRRCR